MKKKGAILLTMLVLMLGIFATQMSCSKKGVKLTQLIAKNAQLVAMVPNIGKAAEDLKTMMEKLATKLPIVGMVKQQLTIATGFDITNAEELAKRGFDPQGGLAVVILDAGGAQGYGIVQVKDKDAFLAFLNETNSKNGKPAFAQEGDFYSSDGTYITFKGKFALIGENQETLKNVGKGDSISGSDDFNSIMKKIGDGDVIFYTSPEYMKSFAKKAPQMPDTKALESITNLYGAMGIAINFDKTFIEGKSFTKIMDMARVKKVLGEAGGSDMLAYLPEGAPIIVKSKANFPEIWQWMKEIISSSDPKAKAELENGLAEAKNQLGFDVEADAIANIEGNPVFVVYGVSGSQNPLDMVATVMLKDEEKIKGLLANLAKMAPPAPANLSQMGVVVFPIDFRSSVYFAVRNKHLVVSLTPERITQVINILDGKEKAKNVIETADPAVKAYLENKDSNVAYVGIGALLNIIKRGLGEKEAKQMEMFTGGPALNNAYLLALGDVEGDGVTYSLKLFWGE